MCDYHLRNNCFHPEKVQKGIVARPCEVHECEHCTSTSWQKQKIDATFAYYQGIIDLMNSPSELTPHNEGLQAIQEKESKLRTRKTSFLFKNPLQSLFK